MGQMNSYRNVFKDVYSSENKRKISNLGILIQSAHTFRPWENP